MIAVGQISGLPGGGADLELRLRPQADGFLHGEIQIRSPSFGTEPIEGFVRGNEVAFSATFGIETYTFEGHFGADRLSGTYLSNPSNLSGTWTAKNDGRQPPPPPPVGTAASNPAPVLDLTGTFSGTLSGSNNGVAFSTTITFTMIQNGQELSAIWVTGNGASGRIRGGAGADEISELSAVQTNPCGGTFQGAATVAENGSKLLGSYAGNDCKGEVDASFVVTRQ